MSSDDKGNSRIPDPNQGERKGAGPNTGGASKQEDLWRARTSDLLKGGTRKMIGTLGKWAEQASRKASDGVTSARDAGKERLDEMLSGKTGLVLADSVERLTSSDNPLIRLETQKVPQNFRASFLYAAAAAGMFAGAEEVTRVTRALMDDDTAIVQQWLRKVFSPEQAADISAWMDRVPGSEIAGGFGHRLFHGHDLQSMVELMRDHGPVGAIEWTNHVWGRDFWTPHGVPFLPAGSDSAYQWLLDMGVSPATALSMLSVNAAEAASGLLALNSIRRAARSIEAGIKARHYQKFLNEVRRHVSEGSDKDALRLIDEVETHSDTEVAPHLRLDFAIFCLGQSQRPGNEHASGWGSRAFLIASTLCRAARNLPDAVPYHGDTSVSFHGLAATILAASYSSQVQNLNMEWDLVSARLEFGVKQFLHIANEQGKASKLQLGGKPVWGYRPYSALTNQLLALELTTAYGSLCGTSIDPMMIRRKMADELSELSAHADESGGFARGIERNLDRVYPHAAAS